MAMLRPDINTWGWSVALWEISALRAFQSSNVAKWTNSRRKILILLRRWLRRYFEIGTGVFFSEPQIKQHNVICILFNFWVHCGVGTPQAKWLMRIACVSTASWGLCSNVPSTGPVGGWVRSDSVCVRAKCVLGRMNGTQTEMHLFGMWKSWYYEKWKVM